MAGLSGGGIFRSDLLGAHEVGGILIRYILIHTGFD